ncbi:MAG: patatin-like phospholipase family protein [Actinomycetota bacterium]|nr:patatin-like phospholipase family protein [Actinomycetota bacterium]
MADGRVADDPVTDPARPRRSLIMAGGGTKVALQAGVLQVWLDEAGLEFDHADGASGGVFNLAMWCQGMTGTQIADNWRRNQPLRGIQPNLRGLLTIPFGESLFRLDRFRRNVFGAWGLSWPLIRSTTREATFNLYNFTRHDQVVLTADQMDEDRLISAVSLPIWFPPVRIDGDVYIDAVFATDANLAEAVRRGADELWVIWTVSERGEWHAGFVAHYFQMIEAMANSHFRAMVRRIERNNEAVASGDHGEFGRRIELKVLQAEVPLHYLMNFTRDRMAAAVELGVQAGRRWCREEGIPLAPGPELTSGMERPPGLPPPASVRFTEEMTGYAGFGFDDHDAGATAGRDAGAELMFHLTIDVDDIDRFVVDPDHDATAAGWVDSEVLGGRRPVERGVFNLFVSEADPRDKRMLYQLWFRDGSGRPLTLVGHKVVKDHPGFDVWSDTTTLYTRVLAGHVTLAEAEADAHTAEVVAAGILRIRPLAFARQLTTFRSSGPTLGSRLSALSRFGRLFVGSLWDVYLRELLSSSPV